MQLVNYSKCYYYIDLIFPNLGLINSLSYAVCFYGI